MGMECTIYMGAHDVARQRPNVERMELMGATVTPVTQGSAGLKDAVDAALSQWCTQLEDTFYVLGSATGPHPFPTLVRYFQAVISAESRRQVSERFSRLPDAVVACVGGGSNAIGAFASYIDATRSPWWVSNRPAKAWTRPSTAHPSARDAPESCTAPAPT